MKRVFFLHRNNRRVGGRYEEVAADFLKKQGLYIVEMNFRCKNGEIDLIARDGKYLVFVEVKYRSDQSSGWASSAVNYSKQLRISRAAAFYLIRHGYGEVPCRFDVVAIDNKEIEWIQNAFLFRG